MTFSLLQTVLTEWLLDNGFVCTPDHQNVFKLPGQEDYSVHFAVQLVSANNVDGPKSVFLSGAMLNGPFKREAYSIADILSNVQPILDFRESFLQSHLYLIWQKLKSDLAIHNLQLVHMPHYAADVRSDVRKDNSETNSKLRFYVDLNEQLKVELHIDTAIYYFPLTNYAEVEQFVEALEWRS